LSLGWSLETKNIIGVIINLLSSFFSGIMVVVLRNICIKTSSVENPKIKMTVLEVNIKIKKITMYKMLLSCFFILISSIILENVIMKPSFFEELVNEIDYVFFFILVGTFEY
jgi:hypothetical protein